MTQTSQESHAVEPLITAEEMYPRLEDLVLSAKHEILMSFRVFDPETLLHSDAALELGLENWGDLMAYICEQGVSVRILIADFDPVFGRSLHEDAQRCANVFSEKLSGDGDVMSFTHRHRAGPFWRLLLRGKIRARLREIYEENKGRMTRQQLMALKRGATLYPVTLHQKFAVIDSERAVIGGLDINERRWDGKTHDQAPGDTWYDVSVSVAGPVCHDIRAHFVDTWSEALVAGAKPLRGRDAPKASDPVDTARTPARLVRTMSTGRAGFAVLAPRNMYAEHEELLIEQIDRAERYIHIETQFFRHRPIAEALVRAATRVPDLQVTLVVPTAPERIEIEGDFGIDARFANGLQIRNIEMCRKAFGNRFVAMSPRIKRSQKAEDTGALTGTPLVYVHAKLTVIDDRWAIVGSANLNGRSLRWDTEASLAFESKEAATHLHQRLADKWLELGDDQRICASAWREQAEKNLEMGPERQIGFLIPYPEEINRRFSLRFPLLPADMF